VENREGYPPPHWRKGPGRELCPLPGKFFGEGEMTENFSYFLLKIPIILTLSDTFIS